MVDLLVATLVVVLVVYLVEMKVVLSVDAWAVS